MDLGNIITEVLLQKKKKNEETFFLINLMFLLNMSIWGEREKIWLDIYHLLKLYMYTSI